MAHTYFDAMCVIKLLADAGRPTTPNDLISSAPEGQMVALALQGKLSIDTSEHVLDVVFLKLQEKYGFERHEAAQAVAAFANLVSSTGGVRAGKQTNVTEAMNLVPLNLHTRTKTDGLVDHEDFLMIAGLLAAGSQVLVTRDAAVLDASGSFAARRGIALIHPTKFASRRIG